MKNADDDFAIHLNQWYGQYLDASLEQQQSEINLALCAASRANALARLHDAGWSMAEIAEAAQLSRERVWQLIDRDRRARGV
jgi:DNA-binding phage protein